MGQANLKAVTGPAIGRWNAWRGTDRQPLPIRTQQKDACKRILPTHLLNGPEVPIEDVFEAVPTLELGRNFAAAILQ
jgi:hypothetical protein